ncbi:MAG: F0F1 ATP synthase subunit alpha [Candidatus Omnitrophota bacterium]
MKPTVEITEVGKIIDVKGDIINIAGIPNCVYGEVLYLEGGGKSIVIEFNEKRVVALLLTSGINIKAGDKIVSKSELFKVAVDEKLLGRIVNGQVQPIDGKGPLEGEDLEYRAVFQDAPPIMSRVPISEPMHTGIKLIDTITPIGKGQRELILGDRQTGKTTIAVDAIINQKNENMICIYCWVGGSYTSMVKVIETLSEKGALDYTIFVAAPASVLSTEQYLAPYTAAAIGEYFVKRDKDVLVIFDNLTKHAWIYRQISLLLNRFPGREAYPGDIFYMHSQLMERACRMHPKKGGSMTFLPIADTLQGDVTGYVQTNLISMTDGQLYTSAALFNEGFRPAIDIGLSVSRIGNKVQSSALKDVSAGLRREYAQFRGLQKLTKLRTKISEKIAQKINRGQTLIELLIQSANAPISEMDEILIFYAFNRGILDHLSGEEVFEFEKNILIFMKEYDARFMLEFGYHRKLTEDAKNKIDKGFLEYFKKQGVKSDERRATNDERRTTRDEL